MGEIVTIKGNRYGLSVTLDETTDFETLCEAFSSKLEEGRKFFGTSKISLQFEGRTLTNEEAAVLVSLVHKHSDMTVFCVVDEKMPVVSPEEFQRTPKQVEIVTDTIVKSIIPVEAAVFHQGTLRSGQAIDMDTGVVIFGDVNPGAKVTAKGNIIVIGKLKGYAHAGSGGNDKACIVALSMQPTQVRISHHIARSPDRFDEKDTQPMIALVEGDRIVMDFIDSNLHRHFSVLK